MTDDRTIRRKRLLFRCHHTGMKENDLLIGTFADRHLDQLSDDDVAWLEALLMDHNDLDIHNWIVGRQAVPEDLDHPVMRMLQTFKFVQ
ncbi:MAG: succinate dehydrogenase assembly factor 2 [Rhodospirillales bacterium]|nr:MAG: succinate dehydrogenase assembly factor 2 [Rhodospirillales bacterium]